MVKKLALFFAYFIVFVFALIAFTPKESIYYFAEQQLQVFDVVISKENLDDKFFALEIEDATVYGQNIEAARVEKTTATLLGVYNSIDVENVQLASFVESFLPKDIQHISVSYSIFNPLELTIFANGDFGEIEGGISLVEQKLLLVLKPSKLMRSKYRTTLREFKKESNGEYSYAKTL